MWSFKMDEQLMSWATSRPEVVVFIFLFFPPFATKYFHYQTAADVHMKLLCFSGLAGRREE